MTTIHTPTQEGVSAARSSAIVAGAGLAAMAVIAPIAVFAALPAGLTALAGVLLLVVAVLDVMVAYALVAVLDPTDSTLARITAGLRVAYAAAFAVAASRLLTADDVAGFQQIWDASLLLFAAHLIALALLGWRAGILPRWIGALVMLAGAGYLIDVVGPAFGVELDISTVSFVGEVVLLIWLLIRGLRKTTGSRATHPRQSVGSTRPAR